MIFTPPLLIIILAGTFRMAHLASGWFCLNADDFIECSCPDYSNCHKCKENCPLPKKKCLSLPYLGRDIIGFKKPMAVHSFLKGH